MAEDIQGVQVVKGGASVDRAADYDYIANSSWPTMNIVKNAYFEVVVPGQNFPNGIDVYEHNLGYYAPYFVYSPTNSDPNKLSLSEGLYNFKDRLNTGPIYNFGGSPITLRYYYILFDYNLEKPFNIGRGKSATPTSAVSSEYGIKTLSGSRVGRDIESPRLEDYTVNTQGQSLTVHMNGKYEISASTNYRIDITHSLGYLPSFTMWKKHATLEAIGPDIYSVTADEVRMSAQGIQSVILGDFYYLITKDPFVLELP